MNIFHEIYVSNMTTVLILMPFLVLAWSVFGAIFHKYMRIIGVTVAVLSIAVILYMTVFSRSGSEKGIDLIPFSSFERAKIQPEMYRSMLMNVFLFVPLGLSLPFVFGGGIGKRLLCAVLVGLLLSAAVEAIQYFAHLGMSETDDVICNTVGTAIAACAYPLSLLWRKFRNNKKST